MFNTGELRRRPGSLDGKQLGVICPVAAGTIQSHYREIGVVSGVNWVNGVCVLLLFTAIMDPYRRTMPPPPPPPSSSTISTLPDASPDAMSHDALPEKYKKLKRRFHEMQLRCNDLVLELHRASDQNRRLGREKE